MTPRQKVRIVNQSTLVSADDFAAMCEAVKEQVHVACDVWHRRVPEITHATVPPQDSVQLNPSTALLAEDGEWVLVLVDTADQAGDLGWHTENDTGIYGFVFARPSLNAGSTALTGTYAVSSVLSHEILETLIDPDVNEWWQINADALVAAEVCDPVEDQTYNVTIDGTEAGQGKSVALSNFILPSWADESADAGTKLDYMGNCAHAFDVSKGGYVVIWDTKTNRVAQMFGEQMPDLRQEYKQRPSGRSARRVAAHNA